MKINDTESHAVHVCPNGDCGRSFERPIKLTVLCSNPVETYLACPFCMSRVELDEEKPKSLKSVLPVTVPDIGQEQRDEKQEAKESSKAECLHGLGYLKTRPKGKPIPDECLTCPKMIQCLM